MRSAGLEEIEIPIYIFEKNIKNLRCPDGWKEDLKNPLLRAKIELWQLVYYLVCKNLCSFQKAMPTQSIEEAEALFS